MLPTKANRMAAVLGVCLGLLPVIWLALQIAPGLHGGLPVILPLLSESFRHPFSIPWCPDSPRALLILLLIYSFALIAGFSARRNYRRGEEHGSARWGELHTIARRYHQEPPEQNRILTEHISIGYRMQQHRRNMNTLVIGGSGAGKTRFYAKPNILQANTSLFVLDPNGYNLVG